MRSTAKTGDITEHLIIAYLIQTGFIVYRPVLSNGRCDLIYEQGGQLVRAQCKTARLKNGAYVFNAYSVANGKRHPYTDQEIDVFLVRCDGWLACLPVTKVGKSEVSLRVTPPRIASKNIRWLKDYYL